MLYFYSFSFSTRLRFHSPHIPRFDITNRSNIFRNRTFISFFAKGGNSLVRGYLILAVILFLFCFFTPPRNRGGVIFSLQFVCVCVCPEFLWTKFQPNGCTDLDAVFAKWLLTTLAQILLKLVTLGQMSRSRWPKMYVKMMKKIRQKVISRHF